jgi:Uma2 family endonuclease
MRIGKALSTFVDDRQLGLCFSDNTGFELPGLDDTVRSPDTAFVRADRLPPHGVGEGWVPVAPDLVVEILSPRETAATLEEKLRDYRAAGTTLVWVIDPPTRTVSVREVGQPERRLAATDSLKGGTLLPGFSLPIATLFEGLSR